METEETGIRDIKSYLELVDLKEENKKLDEEIKDLQRRNNLLQQLLD